MPKSSPSKIKTEKQPASPPKQAGRKVERISVVVPANPFTPTAVANTRHCLCALDVCKLMEWWPGLPHSPHRDLTKVKAIQRSLDWKRVATIASYLLQQEIEDCGDVLNDVFGKIYNPKKNEPGREWPPSIKKTVGYAESSFPFFSNILVHVNGARLETDENLFGRAAQIVLDPEHSDFLFTVIDGQHRVNGAYLALMIRQKTDPKAKFDIPAEVFLDLDASGTPPTRQAQIFIDVNLYQKKVDRSLVADLFPLARGKQDSIDLSISRKARAQDIGRRLMLETGPLVGMIQIPGIKYGTKDVVALATLNTAIEGAIPALDACDISNLEAQSSFIAQVLDCWLDASGRAQTASKALDPQNVVYQGRVLVSVIDLVPAILAHLITQELSFVSDDARDALKTWLHTCMRKAGLLDGNKFLNKEEFREMQFLGSGGIGRFRDRLWAASASKTALGTFSAERIAELAYRARQKANESLGTYAN